MPVPFTFTGDKRKLDSDFEPEGTPERAQKRYKSADQALVVVNTLLEPIITCFFTEQDPGKYPGRSPGAESGGARLCEEDASASRPFGCERPHSNGSDFRGSVSRHGSMR